MLIPSTPDSDTGLSAGAGAATDLAHPPRGPQGLWTAAGVPHRSKVGREIRLTLVALVVTVSAAALSLIDITGVLATRLGAEAWSALAAQLLFLLIVGSLVYGAGVYHLARLGHLRRLGRHAPAPDTALDAVYEEACSPLVTVLVPSYQEERHVVGRTLLAAALQTYPNRRVVLLIDDAPTPTTSADAARLTAARGLPMQIERLLAGPRHRCASALHAFRQRRAAGPLDVCGEHARLADLHTATADWMDEQGRAYPSQDHADRTFVQLVFHTLGCGYRREAQRLAAVAAGEEPPREVPALERAYRRLVAQFDVELTSFERKRYDNLSHEPNKAMNLNSYIALLGGTYREVVRTGALVLESDADGPLRVPDSEFVVVVDADSVIAPDYALRLVHVMRQPGQEKTAIVQTPYRAFPGAASVVERVAGATTDIQCLVHQGFSGYDATYWVGANAVIRTAALRDIVSYGVERGHRIARFIQDRTLIEDTESTVDLLGHGWRLSNYPERLAYSETPSDFGSLLIQRRRWANGGLIILPRLLRYAASGGRDRLAQTFMMVHYLTSLGAVNLGLLLMLAFSFEDSMRSFWLPLTAVPYYVLYARDLRFSGYGARDALRTYALNLVLIPVNLVGVVGSLYQAATGSKAAFGRTPKVRGRTAVPAIYLLAEVGLCLQWVIRALSDALAGRPLHAALTAANVGLFLYGLAVFIGVRAFVEDLRLTDQAAALAGADRNEGFLNPEPTT